MTARKTGGWHWRRPLAATLTDQDLVIVRLIAEGLSQKDVAADLELSKQTIAKHVQRAIVRLGAQNITHVVGLLDDYRPGWRRQLPFPLDLSRLPEVTA